MSYDKLKTDLDASRAYAAQLSLWPHSPPFPPSSLPTQTQPIIAHSKLTKASCRFNQQLSISTV